MSLSFTRFAEVWRSDTIPIITKKKKRLALFNPDEQKEVNRARVMRALPNLSLVVGKQLGFAKKTRADIASSPEIGDPNVTESDVEAKIVRRAERKKLKLPRRSASGKVL